MAVMRRDGRYAIVEAAREVRTVTAPGRMVKPTVEDDRASPSTPPPRAPKSYVELGRRPLIRPGETLDLTGHLRAASSRRPPPSDPQRDDPEHAAVEPLSRAPAAKWRPRRGHARALDSGVLGVVSLRVGSAADAEKLAAAEAGQVQRFSGWDEWTASEFNVGRVEVGVDGEALVLDPPLRFTAPARHARLSARGSSTIACCPSPHASLPGRHSLAGCDRAGSGARMSGPTGPSLSKRCSPRASKVAARLAWPGSCGCCGDWTRPTQRLSRRGRAEHAVARRAATPGVRLRRLLQTSWLLVAGPRRVRWGEGAPCPSRG